MEPVLKILKRYPVAVALALVAVVVFGYYSMRGGSFDSVQIERDELAGELRKMEATIRNLQGATEQGAIVQEIVDSFGSRLIVPSDRAINLDFFYQMEQDFAVEIDPVQESARPRKRGGKNNPWSLTNHGEVRFSLAVRGSLREVLRFVDSLPHRGKFISIRQADYRGDPAKPESVQVNLQIDMLSNL